MRRTLIAIVLAGLLMTSGCIGFLQGDTPLSFESDPAVASDAALSESGYGNETLTEVPLNRTITVQNQTREVEVINWNAQYQKDAGIGPASQKVAVFATFTTPSFSILGEDLSPVSNMTNEEVLQHALSGRAGLGEVTHVRDTNAVVLGKGATVSTFRTSVDSGGDFIAYEQDLYVHVTKVKHDGDYVIVVGAHPVQMDDRENVIRLMESLEHGER
jgi:hypothetical protein